MPHRHGPPDGVVVQRHLDALVGVLVVHVVDDVQGVDVRPGQPVHHPVERLEHLVVVEVLAVIGGVAGPTWSPLTSSRPPLIAYSSVLARLTRAPKNCICLPTAHRRHAAGDRGVVAVRRAHQVVGLVLDRRGVDRHLRAELLEALRAARRPEHRQVRLGRRAEVVQGLQEAEELFLVTSVRPSSPMPPMRLGDPGRVAGEQLVVLRGAQEAHDPQLDDEVVDQLLRLDLVSRPSAHVALEVDVEEGRGAAERHGRAVLLLDRREVREVQPLDRLAARCRPGRRCRSRTRRPSP